MSKDIPEKIADLDKVEFKKVDISFISNSNNKQSKLFNNEDDDFTYKLCNKEYEFNFNEPLFIESILIKSDSKSLENLKVLATDYFDNQNISIEKIESEDANCVRVYVNRVINSFKLIPPYTYVYKIHLVAIEVFGYELSEFSKVNKIYREAKDLKSEVSLLFNESNLKIENKYTELDEREKKVNEKINASKVELDELSEIINEKSDRLIELKSSIKTEEQNVEQLKDIKQKLKNSESNLSKANIDLKNNIQQQEQTTHVLNQKISSLKAEIDKHLNDKNLFAYELKDFIQEGSSSASKYFWIAIIPMALIAILSYILLSGTVDLTTKYNEDGFNIISVFWSRLPFVIVITSIIFVCYEITKIFFINVIEIQNQKLNFSKIGIIAKDIANTSFEGLELDDNEKFELRTKIKMHLIRGYLANEFRIKRDYNINKSLWARFLEWRQDKKKTNNEGNKLNDAHEDDHFNNDESEH